MLAIVACVGFLYKIQDGVLISPRYIESGAEVEREIEMCKVQAINILGLIILE